MIIYIKVNILTIILLSMKSFLYRWGITSLFHDVAYPLEITIKQLNEYYNYSVSYGEKSMPKKFFLDIGGLDLYKSTTFLYNT